MIDLKEIFVTIGKSLNPFAYKDFHDRSMRRSFKHFLIIILFGVLISGLFYLPELFGISSVVKQSLDSAEELKFNPVISFREPVVIGDFKDFESKAKYTIDTDGTYNATQSEYYFDTEYVYYNYGKNKKHYSEVLDVLAYKTKIKNGLSLILILLIPSLFVSCFIGILILFGSIIFVISLLFTLIFMKWQVSLQKMIITGLYASVILIISMVLQSIKGSFNNFLTSGLTLLIFVGYYLVAVLSTKHPKRKHNRSEDIEIEIPPMGKL